MVWIPDQQKTGDRAGGAEEESGRGGLEAAKRAGTPRAESARLGVGTLRGRCIGRIESLLEKGWSNWMKEATKRHPGAVVREKIWLVGLRAA